MSVPVILITGALTGIGRATAQAFVREGATVVISGRRQAEGHALEAELRGLGAEAAFIAADVRRETGIATRTVGLIVTPKQAEAVVADGKADMVALARAVLDDPHWAWHAAQALGGEVTYPRQYQRAEAAIWPGAALRM